MTADEARKLRAIGDRFRIRIPRYYAELMDRSAKGRDACPIRKQAIPALEEADPTLPSWAQEMSLRTFGREVPWLDDAIGDLAKLAAPRLTHRYENRAILHLSSLCALYCRFCFRKTHLNDAGRALYGGALDPAIDYLRAHGEIRELVLTGGDPLSVSDAVLARLFERLSAVAHLKAVRIHTRMPATLPSRLTDALARMLTAQPFQVALVAHFNHPKELTAVALAALRSFRAKGIPLFNQSVLLRGINDSAEVLAVLFQGLYENGVKPTYLHHPDWTPGTFHFRVPIEHGRAIVRALSGRVSGPALPHYVLDLPGGGGKVLLMDTERVLILESCTADGIAGSIYRIVASPETRSASREARYADFSPVDASFCNE
ncbi:MAG: KamA family radical SAM protein [Deltaproteobacteria bacterium]|nr:KamA family radical SAM protein [Deltaproteobacteria bacterium]